MLGLPVRGAKPFDVVGLGQNSLDTAIVVAAYPVPDSSAPVDALRRFPGGEVATAMVGCARLGCRTRYVGTVGRDPEGDAVRGALAGAGVDLAHVRTVEVPTRTAVILVDRAGRRAVLSSRDPGLDWPSTEPDEHVVTSGRLLLADASDPAASARALAAARRAGVPTVIDIDRDGPRADELLRGVTVVIASPDVCRGAEWERDTRSGLGAPGVRLRRRGRHRDARRRRLADLVERPGSLHAGIFGRGRGYHRRRRRVSGRIHGELDSDVRSAPRSSPACATPRRLPPSTARPLAPKRASRDGERWTRL